MRRNPGPRRPVDRRRLAAEIIEREVREKAMASEIAIAGAREPDLLPHLPTLKLPRKQ